MASNYSTKLEELVRSLSANQRNVICQLIEEIKASEIESEGGQKDAPFEPPTSDRSDSQMLNDVVNNLYPSNGEVVEYDFSQSPPPQVKVSEQVLDTPQVDRFSQEWGNNTINAILDGCPDSDVPEPSAANLHLPPADNILPPPSVIAVWESDRVIERRVQNSAQNSAQNSDVEYVPPEDDEVGPDAQLLAYEDIEDVEAGPSGLEPKGEKEKGTLGK